LAAPQRPEMADLVGPESLCKVIEQLAEVYGFVLVDTASFLDQRTVAVLDLADCIILIVTPEVYSFRGARLFCETEMAQAYPPQKINVVLNKVGAHGRLRPDDVPRIIPYNFLGPVAKDNETATTAVNSGIPILTGDSNKPICRDIYGLTRRLLKILTEAEQPTGEPAVQPAKPAAPRQRAGCSLLSGGALALLGLALIVGLGFHRRTLFGL
jgi:pilus assembly protein CpaE